MLDTDKLNLCPAVNILKKSFEISRIYARSHENRVKGKSKHIFCGPCLAPQIRFLFFSLSVSRSSPLFLGNTFFREICLTVYKGRCKQPPPRGVVPESMGMGRVSGTGMGAPLLLRQPLRMQEVRQVGSLASRQVGRGESGQVYNADCSRCACIHVPGVQPVTKGNLVSIFEKDGCGPRSTGFLLFDLFEIAYISCVRICVCVWGQVRARVSFSIICLFYSQYSGGLQFLHHKYKSFFATSGVQRCFCFLIGE